MKIRDNRITYTFSRKPGDIKTSKAIELIKLDCEQKGITFSSVVCRALQSYCNTELK